MYFVHVSDVFLYQGNCLISILRNVENAFFSYCDVFGELLWKIVSIGCTWELNCWHCSTSRVFLFRPPFFEYSFLRLDRTEPNRTEPNRTEPNCVWTEGKLWSQTRVTPLVSASAPSIISMVVCILRYVMRGTGRCKVVRVPCPVPSVAGRPLSRSPYPNSPTPTPLFTSAAANAETRWLRYEL